ncbi:MAG: PQQ-dependent sugar dehydrogenase [Crocinitomicaceae bacterium]
MKNFALICCCFFALKSQSQGNITVGSTTVEVDTVYTGLDIPWEIIFGPDGFIWTTERKGIISIIDPVSKTKTVVLNIVTSVYQNSESGLLGMALHPEFLTTPEVFIAYTYGSFSNIQEKVVKYTYNGSALVNEVIVIDNIVGNTTHNGSRISILPDNTLLFSTGDAQNPAFPQDINELNGKVLRVNMDGSIPADNPFPGNPVYSFGHRNIQGILQHPNGKVYLSEHGASTDDEFQILEVGRNYGWPNVEGFCDPGGEQTFCDANNVVEPLVAWTPTIAPSDMVYYANPLFPEFDGRVLMSVLKDKRIIAVKLNVDGLAVIDEDHYLINQFGRLRDICVGPSNEIYIATNGQSWSNSNPNTHSIIVLRALPISGVNTLFSNDIQVRPNPVKDNFQLEVESNHLGSLVEIKDMSGRLVYQSTVSELSSTIDVSILNKGSYILTLSKGNQISIRKLLK